MENHRGPGPAVMMADVSEVMEKVRRLAARQDDVVALRQVVGLGLDDARARRLVAGGWWQRPFRGVLVVHGGPMPAATRARAALVYAGAGAVLSHDSAAELHGFARRPTTLVEVMVPRPRTVAPARGLRVTRSDRIPVDPASPYRQPLPRTSGPATVVDLVARVRADALVGLLTAAVRVGVDPEEIYRELLARPNAKGRGPALEILAEVATGVESPMELRYRRDVERRHGLPAARAQVRGVVGGRWIRADAWYEGLAVRVELDGELGHPGGRTARDTWRDNAVGIEARELTLRYRWAHVAGDPCLTASQVAAALASRGWTGLPRPCSPICAVGDPDRRFGLGGPSLAR